LTEGGRGEVNKAPVKTHAGKLRDWAEGLEENVKKNTKSSVGEGGTRTRRT